MREITLVMLKPPCLTQGLVGTMIKHLELAGMRLEYIRRDTLNIPQVKALYSHVSGLPFFEDMAKFYTSEDVIIMLVSGDNAITAVRDLIRELRDAYGNTQVSYDNKIHASDGPLSLASDCRILGVMGGSY